LPPAIERACYWLAQRGPREITTLESVVEADVAIVGAGMTGLWTALFLKELDPGAGVVVLEREVAAYGASGRNAGMLSETVDHGHGLAIQHFGEAEARRLAQLGEHNVEEMVAWLDARGIDCDYEPTGRLHAALTDAQVEDGRRAVATDLLRTRKIRHLPVVEQGRLVGIISIGDVMKAQRDQYQGEVDTLQFQLIGEQDRSAARA